MNVQINSDELRVLKENSEILTRLISSEEYIRRKYVEITEQLIIENRIEEVCDGFIDSLNDLLAEAEVDEPAGRGCGYAIHFDEVFVKKLLKEFLDDVKEIENE